MATINLSDEVLAHVTAQAAAAGYATLDEYVIAVLRAEVERDSFTAPEHLSVQNHQRAVALVREGLASPVREISAGEARPVG